MLNYLLDLERGSIGVWRSLRTIVAGAILYEATYCWLEADVEKMIRGARGWTSPWRIKTGEWSAIQRYKYGYRTNARTYVYLYLPRYLVNPHNCT
jgi:hypothetical protein